MYLRIPAQDTKVVASGLDLVTLGEKVMKKNIPELITWLNVLRMKADWVVSEGGIVMGFEKKQSPVFETLFLHLEFSRDIALFYDGLLHKCFSMGRRGAMLVNDPIYRGVNFYPGRTLSTDSMLLAELEELMLAAAELNTSPTWASERLVSGIAD
jgi:hypothetical protein